LSGLWNGIISDAKGIFNSLGSFFSDLGQQAFQWGANLVNMIAEGIKHAASAVADAAKNVVGSVAGFLGFHSPAKEGPGADADTWMPNLFKMMTDQIY
jgi:phage-related protein